MAKKTKGKSRQHVWIDRCATKGQCVMCARPVALKKNGKRARYCTAHLVYNRERMRKTLKLKSRYRGATSYKNEVMLRKLEHG